MNKEVIIEVLKNEIDVIKTRLQPQDTGHLYDYIANMKRRVEELENEENQT